MADQSKELHCVVHYVMHFAMFTELADQSKELHCVMHYVLHYVMHYVMFTELADQSKELLGDAGGNTPCASPALRAETELARDLARGAISAQP